MSDGPRARKLADRIQEVVARQLDTRVKDPRLGFVTVTEVKVTGDLQHATIFYTVYGSDAERASTAAALESAKGMLRTEVGRATRLRLTPTLEFVPDALPETAATLEEALRRASERDAQVAAQAAGAQYAGEQDPYKKRPEDDALDAGLDPAANLAEDVPYADDYDGDLAQDLDAEFEDGADAAQGDVIGGDGR